MTSVRSLPAGITGIAITKKGKVWLATAHTSGGVWTPECSGKTPETAMAAVLDRINLTAAPKRSAAADFDAEDEFDFG